MERILLEVEGYAVLIFLMPVWDRGKRNLAVAEAQAKREVVTKSEEVKLRGDKG